jgi:hypothetical protein
MRPLAAPFQTTHRQGSKRVRGSRLLTLPGAAAPPRWTHAPPPPARLAQLWPPPPPPPSRLPAPLFSASGTGLRRSNAQWCPVRRGGWAQPVRRAFLLPLPHAVPKIIWASSQVQGCAVPAAQATCRGSCCCNKYGEQLHTCTPSCSHSRHPGEFLSAALPAAAAAAGTSKHQTALKSQQARRPARCRQRAMAAGPGRARSRAGWLGPRQAGR